MQSSAWHESSQHSPALDPRTHGKSGGACQRVGDRVCVSAHGNAWHYGALKLGRDTGRARLHAAILLDARSQPGSEGSWRSDIWTLDADHRVSEGSGRPPAFRSEERRVGKV